jgi:aspartyl-tRNA(Asn)/glutamyl-tRNA(Gln) amidotransferase subunit A
MMDESLAQASVHHQAEMISQRRVSPVELVSMYVERIERYDVHVRAFVTVLAEEALSCARLAEAELQCGNYRGPLHGIPFAVKDVFDIANVRTTAGSRTQVEAVATGTATVIQRLRDAGAILLGTLNTDELQVGGTRDFPFGTPRNPWALDRITGGSSAGSATAVAAGLCSFSLGGDTGGSIRAPAALCGVVGFRPTWSRVSRSGMVPACWRLDCVGTMARSARDIALILRVIAGHDPLDVTSSSAPVPDFPQRLGLRLDGVRFGLVRQMYELTGIADDVRAVIDDATVVLEQLGGTVTLVDLPELAMTEAA